MVEWSIPRKVESKMVAYAKLVETRTMDKEKSSNRKWYKMEKQNAFTVTVSKTIII